MLGGLLREVLGQTELFRFGFYTLHVVDVPVALTIFAWGACQARTLPKLNLISFVTYAISVLLLINLVRGFALSGAAALLWARINIEAGALLLLAVTCRANETVCRSFRRAIVWCSIGIAMLVAARIVLGPSLFMLNTSEISNADINDGGRAITATGAFTLSLAVVLLLSEAIQRRVGGSTGRLVLALTLSAAEIASGQGTATIALLVMLAVIIAFSPGPLRSVRLASVAILVLITGVSAALFAGVAPSGSVAGFDLARRSGNLATRENVWAGLMSYFADLPLVNQLIGLPAGVQPYIIVTVWSEPRVWTNAIHSMYYGSLPIMGYVGLSLFVALLAWTFVQLVWRTARETGAMATPAYPAAFCLGTGIIAYSYEVRNEMWIAMFVAIFWVRYRPMKLHKTPDLS